FSGIFNSLFCGSKQKQALADAFSVFSSGKTGAEPLLYGLIPPSVFNIVIDVIKAVSADWFIQIYASFPVDIQLYNSL
ncbi:MAG: hypothetical protein K2O18_09650, partial [Oscillospiraceae bacterium]|nr:hypothetical protein [Oscillospiraceae bacterium]